MKENRIKLILPLPPSVNECFRWYPKRVKTDKYKNWLSEAWNIIRDKMYNISGSEWLEAKVIVYTELFYKNWNKKKQDLDNFLKPTFDCLWEYIPWFKDEYIVKIIATKVDSDRKEIEIEIKEIINN